MPEEILIEDGDPDWPYWASRPFIQKAGGLLDPREGDYFIRNICALVHVIFERACVDTDWHGGTKPCLVFIASEKANAWMVRDSERYAVCVSIGLLEEIWRHCLIISALPDILTHEGRSQSPMGWTSLPMRAAIDAMDWRFIPAEVWPEDRADHSHDLFCRSIDFILRHEIAHIQRGHLDLLKRAGIAQDSIDEMLALARAHTSKNPLYFMEFDADLISLDTILVDADEAAPLKTWDADEAAFHLLRWNMALILVFMSFDHAGLANERHYQGSHPAPVHRAIRTTASLSAAVARECGLSEDRRMTCHDDAWAFGAMLARSLGAREGRWFGDGTTGMSFELLRSHEDELRAFMARLDREADEGA